LDLLVFAEVPEAVPAHQPVPLSPAVTVFPARVTLADPTTRLAAAANWPAAGAAAPAELAETAHIVSVETAVMV
jgi:hypothetical protein